MFVTRKAWFRFIFFALIAFAIWAKFTLPKISFINLSIDKPSALKIAKDHLADEKGIDLTPYRHAVVFSVARSPDQYLQKAIGFEEELKFFKEHHYELFFWNVRFFEENKVEEYRVSVSAASGEITGFSHKIEESAPRPEQDEETAKKKVIAFLQNKFQFNPENYILHSNFSKSHDNRTDYSFSWEKKGVFVRWSEEEDTGGAKLLTGARISGDEILAYNKMSLQIPSQFRRYISREKNVGRNLSILFRIVFFALLTSSIFFVVVRRNNLVMHATKRFCITITVIIFALNVVSYFNNFESILYRYPTTSSFISYLWRHITHFLMDTFIVTISILMPCLAGESLRYEVSPDKRERSFLHYILSTTLSRNISWSIVLGYCVAVIMVGIQSAAFEFGQKYLGVWVEYSWMAQLSSSYFPFLAAFILGFVASSTEEIAFRLFSINFGKKFLKNTFLAVLAASIIWGYGHSTYLVFPMWFRGLEVTCLGLFLSFVYLRYGIIPVLVAHFLFDVFWSSSAYLLGQSTPYHFYSALGVLFLPILFAILAYVKNRPETERPLRWQLNRHQIYNLEVLKKFLKSTPHLKNKSKEEVKEEIIAHGWDIAVVEIALKDLGE